MHIGLQIKAKRKSLKLSADALGKLLGGIPEDRIYKWEQGVAEPKNEDRNLILEWLSENNMKISESEVPETYLQKRRNQKNGNNPYLVPFVDIPAQAGYRKAYSDIDYILTLKHYPILPDVDPMGASWRYFQVEGDSMSPVLMDRDTVLASLVMQEDWQDIRDKYTYVIVTHTELLIKDIQKYSEKQWILLSQNESYEPRLIDVNDVRQIWIARRRVQNRFPKDRMYDMGKVFKQLNLKK